MKWINEIFRIACKLQLVSLTLMIMLIASCNLGEKESALLLIGIAEVNYTPAVGLKLVGNYRGDDYASRGVHDSLFARALVASDSMGEKAALLTIDICMLYKESVEMMRSYIASKTNIKPGNIMIHATHKHSGPRSDMDAPKVK